MPTYTILTPQTTAGNSKPVEVVTSEQAELENDTLLRVRAPCSIAIAPVPAVAETALFEISVDNGTTWVKYFPQDSGGVQLSLSDQQNLLTIYGPALLRVVKGVTTTTSGLYVFSGGDRR